MKIVQADFNNGTEEETCYFLFDNNAKKSFIEEKIRTEANAFFEDLIYTNQGYDIDYGWESSEDEDNYYENCSYETTELTIEQWNKKEKFIDPIIIYD